jgi:hypothetical protein
VRLASRRLPCRQQRNRFKQIIQRPPSNTRRHRRLAPAGGFGNRLAIWAMATGGRRIARPVTPFLGDRQPAGACPPHVRNSMIGLVAPQRLKADYNELHWPRPARTARGARGSNADALRSACFESADLGSGRRDTCLIWQVSVRRFQRARPSVCARSRRERPVWRRTRLAVGSFLGVSPANPRAVLTRVHSLGEMHQERDRSHD